MARMCVDIGNREYRPRTSAKLGPVLFFATFGLAFVPACGDHSSSGHDADLASAGGSGGSTPLGAGGSPTAGTGGTSNDANAAGDTAAIDCPYLPCLTAAVSAVDRCQPSHTCTSQMTTSGAVVSCFDNGITVIVHNLSNTSSTNLVVMGVKKNGTFCYGMDSASTSGAAATLTYRDANNQTVITVFTDDSGATHAMCPDSNVSFTVSPGSACMAAVVALGGITPASACLDVRPGDCSY
jgi:hypothetical protein